MYIVRDDLLCSIKINYMSGQEKKIGFQLSSGQVSLPAVSLVPLLTLVVLWASWKELKEQACYIACPEKYAEELCPK